MSTLRGQVALITGAGQGIGLGVALALATEGVDIAVVGRTESKLVGACEQLQARGVRAEPFVADLFDTELIPRVVDRVTETFGGVDILVNNAYNGSLGRLLELDDRAFQRGFMSGPFAAFAFMRACHPVMKARGGGNIINMVTSAIVRWDPTDYGAYAAAKVALRSLTRTAAVEWAVDGIRVNSIAPHAITPALERWITNRPEEAEAFLQSIPQRRIGEPEADIGRAVVAVVGSDLGYLTGATLPLDGGQAHF